MEHINSRTKIAAQIIRVFVKKTKNQRRLTRFRPLENCLFPQNYFGRTGKTTTIRTGLITKKKKLRETGVGEPIVGDPETPPRSSRLTMLQRGLREAVSQAPPERDQPLGQQTFNFFPSGQRSECIEINCLTKTSERIGPWNVRKLKIFHKYFDDLLVCYPCQNTYIWGGDKTFH